MFLLSCSSLSFAFLIDCLLSRLLRCAVRNSATMPVAPHSVLTVTLLARFHLFCCVFLSSCLFCFSLARNSESVIAWTADVSIMIMQSSWVRETSWPSTWQTNGFLIWSIMSTNSLNLYPSPDLNLSRILLYSWNSTSRNFSSPVPRILFSLSNCSALCALFHFAHCFL